MTTESDKGRAEDWLDAAYEALISGGIDAVKIQLLAKTLGTSRTSFYWFFKDREALLAQLLTHWKHKNTGGLIKQTECYAGTVVEAMLNVFDCWLDTELFDADLEYAVRYWALHSNAVAAEVAAADEARLAALTRMLSNFDYPPLEASVRARTIYLTQIGYISMRAVDTPDERISRIAEYVRVFTGQACERADLKRFVARHAPDLTAWMAAFDKGNNEVWLSDR